MGKSMPWGKFFWSDYESDEALRLCSFAAQGLWMRCLCLTAKADPTGYLVINGHSLSTTDIARLTGGSEAEVGELLIELERNGVFSRDAKDRIFSRRMVRDVKKASIAKRNGKQGGNPSLCKQRENPALDNPTDNADLKLRDQIPETRDHIEKKKVHSRKKISYSDDFEAFWKAFMADSRAVRAQGKEAAFIEWKKLSEEDQTQALAAIKPYQDECRKTDQQLKHVERYLRTGVFRNYAAAKIDTTNTVKVGTPEHAALAAWKREQGLPVYDLMTIPEGYTPPEELTNDQ